MSTTVIGNEEKDTSSDATEDAEEGTSTQELSTLESAVDDTDNVTEEQEE